MTYEKANTRKQTDPLGDLSNLVCPFCALVCDDLSLSQHNNQIHTDQLSCAKAQNGYQTALQGQSSQPLLNGEPISLPDALAHAAKLLQQARLPLFHGLQGDLQDARAIWRLAAHFGGVVDHAAGDSIARKLRVFQDTGWQISSLGEVRNRADLVILVGEFDIPRLQEKLFAEEHRLHRQQAVQQVHLQNDALQTIEQLALMQYGRSPLPASAKIESLNQQLMDAQYPVFLLGQLDAEQEELVLRAIVALVRKLNEQSRAALLPLAMGCGDLTAQLSGAWHNGFGIRTDFSRGYPRQDLKQHSAERLLASEEADLLVWISSLSNTTPPSCSQPSIVFGHPGMAFEKAPELYFPIAVPGVHRSGYLHRTDGLRMLPLPQITQNALNSMETLSQQLITVDEQGELVC